MSDPPLNRDVIENLATWLLDGARTVSTPITSSMRWVTDLPGPDCRWSAWRCL